MLEQLKEAQKRLEEISGQVDVFAQAQEAGMEITPQTDTSEAQSFLSQQTPVVSVDGLGETPDIPEPPTPTNTSTYTLGLQQELEKQRAEMEKQYQSQLDTIQKQLEETRKAQEQTIKQQEGVIQQAEPLTQPFRQGIEESERERLKIEENYFENQALINELDSLLTEINSGAIRDQELVRSGAISQTTANERRENAMARVGVIEAVMSARNNQIGTGLNFIDRTLSAITQDRQDRLSYLNTLISFYDQARNEQGQRIFNLEKDERDFLNRQVNLIENDLAQAQANADYIKELMMSPQTAQMVADAGITLNDTPEIVNKKLADYTYKQEKIQIANQMEEQGYQFIPAQVVNTRPAEEIITITDSKGNPLHFWVPPEQQANTFTTADGQALDVSTVAGVKSLINAGYNNYAELYAWYDQNTKLSATAVKNLLQQAGLTPTGTSGTTAKPTTTQLYNDFLPKVKVMLGKNQLSSISWVNWNMLRSQWISMGGSASSFDSNFKEYKPTTAATGTSTSSTSSTATDWAAVAEALSSK